MSSQELFFHGSCFDGAVSCLLVWDYFESAAPRRQVELRPVGYEARPGWLSRRLHEGTAVVDFLFHPDASFWADHHETTFLTRTAQSTYLGAGKPDWIYEPTAPSCAGLLYRWLQSGRIHRNPHFEDVVTWADRIDSAEYDSVEAALFPNQSAPAVSQSFAVRPTPQYSIYIVRLLRRLRGDIDAVASDETVREAIVEARVRTQLGIDRFRQAAQRLEDRLILFDVTEESDGAIMSRYAPFAVDKSARYSVVIVRRPHEAKITAMRNPWLPFQGVDLGKLFERFGGGGHRRVASLRLPGSRTRGGEELVQSIVRGIRDADAGSPVIERAAQ